MSENITDIVTGITNRRVKEIAEQMRDEMREIVSEHSRSGKAYDSIEIHYNNPNSGRGDFGNGAEGSLRGGFMTYVFIGSHEKSAYYLDQGNNQHGGLIYPHGKALVFQGYGRYAGKGNGRNGEYILPSVRAYEGIHFVKEVADRHR